LLDTYPGNLNADAALLAAVIAALSDAPRPVPPTPTRT
jgi:hypothetical protein